ncbi:MAG: hypothetical protein Q8R39_03465 [bacterium]|nr:hypothetical protein [bacterium]
MASSGLGRERIVTRCDKRKTASYRPRARRTCTVSNAHLLITRWTSTLRVVITLCMEIESKEQNIFKYKGPASLKAIEERLLEIEHEKPYRIFNLKEYYSASIEDFIEGEDIEFLNVQKTQLQLKRQFILDKRESWLPKTIWSFLVPIVLAIIAAYITTIFTK